MKITKYPQSAFTIENGGKKLLIDPGTFVFEKYSTEDFSPLDGILITHQHPDHLDLANVKKFVDKDTPLYGNHDVLKLFEKEGFEISKVENDRQFELAGFKIRPVDLPHFKNLWCNACNDKITPKTISKDKKCSLHPDLEPKQIDGPPNTGYVINETFFHPGDGVELSGLKIKGAGIPIGGPTIDYNHGWGLAASISAETIIPMHYSVATFGAEPQEFARLQKTNAKVVVLQDGQSTEV